MTHTVDLECGCQIDVSYDWINGTVETEITYKCDPYLHLNIVKKRIYEVAEIELEEEPISVINFIEWWRGVWSSWQIQGEKITTLTNARDLLIARNKEQQIEIDALRETIEAVPEFMIDSSRDTPRCLWCKGWKKAGGHKPTCQRQAVLNKAVHPPLKEDK